jgi:iduronate 2-sulfatase
MGGTNCDDPKLNPEGCQYIMPNQSYATKKGLNRTSMELMRKVRAGYAGGITWTDIQIGKVLDALEATGEKDNTLTLFWADHGWALGEQSMFCKMANFELQTRVPMLIRAPWLGAKAIGSTTAIVELIDMFPTAVELSGLGVQVDVSITGPLALEGYSVAPLLKDPNLHLNSPDAWKRAAFSQYPRCMNSTQAQTAPFLATRDPCVGHTANQVTHMGYSMRTSDWRYAEWPAWKCFGLDGDVNWCSNMSEPSAVWSGAADWTELAGRELYAHTGDDGSCFDCFENENLVDQPQYTKIVEQLSKQLRAGWRGAAPVVGSPR